MSGSPRDPEFELHAEGGAAAFEARARRGGERLASRLERFLDRHLRTGTRDWAVACHLLPLVAYAAPVPGLSALLAWGVWRTKRDREPGVAAHGREALNLHLNLGLLSAVTLLVFPLWIVLNAVALFLAVKAAVRAAAGEAYRYPWIVRIVE